MSGFVKAMSFKKQNLNFIFELGVKAAAALQSLRLCMGPDFCPHLQGQNPALSLPKKTFPVIGSQIQLKLKKIQL